MPKILVDVVTIWGTPATGPVSVGLTVTAPNAAPEVTLQRGTARLFSYDLPDVEQTFTVSAASSNFWTAAASISFHPNPGGRKSVTLFGIAHKADLSTAGGATTITVTITLQQLADVSKAMGISFGTPHKVMDVQSDILNPGGSGSTLFNIRPSTAPVSQARLFILKWKSSGTSIGVYVPQAALRNLGNYNLFFKPPKHGGWTTQGVVGLYMAWNGNLEHKSLIAQTELSGSSYILCLAFEEDGPLPAYGTSQSGVLNLLEEIDYFLRLYLTGTQASPQVGKVAMSCFSAGANHVSTIIRTFPTTLLAKLKGLFVLDGNDFDLTPLSGVNDRAIRIYVSAEKFKSVPQTTAGTTKRGPNGSFEFRSAAKLSSGDPAVIYFYAPWQVWQTYDPRFGDWMSVHQVIPSYFQSHALKTSGV